MTPMPRLTLRRTAAISALALAVVAVGVGWYFSSESDNEAEMKSYTPQREHQAAQSIIDGLNTRNPKNVPLLRNTSAVPDADADNAQIDANVTAAMPPVGCQYALSSVADRGDQGVQKLPWFSPHETWRFDMTVRQICPGGANTDRTIGVLAIPSGMGGYWAEASLIAGP